MERRIESDTEKAVRSITSMMFDDAR